MLVIEPDVSYAIECVTAVSQLCHRVCCGNICHGIYFVILHDSVLISRLSKNRDKRLSNGVRMTF